MWAEHQMRFIYRVGKKVIWSSVILQPSSQGINSVKRLRWPDYSFWPESMLWIN